jgi:hypothetical protein
MGFWTSVRPYLITLMICGAILGHGWFATHPNPFGPTPPQPHPDPVIPVATIVSDEEAHAWAKALLKSYSDSGLTSETELKAKVGFGDVQKHLEENFKSRRQEAFTGLFNGKITAKIPAGTTNPTQEQVDWMAGFMGELSRKVGDISNKMGAK